MTQRTDALVVAVLLSAHCETDARSFKDLQRDLNALAVWNDKKTIRRRIYRTWPRSPKGEDIHPENSCFGKRTSNKIQLWGSTIWDFFWVNRMPSVERLITISTGSKLSKWMIQHNETEHALFELEWAKEESDPRQIFPYPIVGVIEDQEMRIRLGICGKSMLNAAKEQDGDDKSGSGRDEGVDDEQWESESEDDGGDWDERLGSGDERLGSGDESDDQDDDSHDEEDEEDEESSMDVDQPINTIFGTDAYPAPWPLVPFSYEAPKIEQRLPLHMLPKTLVVHDPWGLLSNTRRHSSYKKPRYDWTLTRDRTYVYKLSLGEQCEERIQEELKAKEEKKKQDRLERLKKAENILEGCDGFLLTPIELAAGPAEPPIFVAHEIVPDPEPVEEAHLYISPEQIIGVGNHSLVLHAEWEVPRSLLVPDILCHECIMEDVQRTLAVLDGEDKSGKSAEWKEKSGLYEKVEKVEPEVTLDMVSEYEKSDMGTCVYDSGSRKTSFGYSGPVRVIKTSVQWQNAERGLYCSHILKRMHLDDRGGITDTLRPHPLTARVSLVAKLSTGDEHLDKEASNYEEFPDHFFEHWTGYNLIPPLHEPTPVNAVIPQYYGYYEPETPMKNKSLSPILLMENCGGQVCVDDLNMDDKHECAALIYRFHEAGYLHNSVYARNMLCQEGPLDRPMYQRGTGEFMEDGRKHAYRLIDFGRSEKDPKRVGRPMEESVVGKLLKHSWYGW